MEELFELELEEEFDELLELEFDELFELELDELFELEFDELLELEFDELFEFEFELEPRPPRSSALLSLRYVLRNSVRLSRDTMSFEKIPLKNLETGSLRLSSASAGAHSALADMMAAVRQAVTFFMIKLLFQTRSVLRDLASKTDGDQAYSRMAFCLWCRRNAMRQPLLVSSL